jgi:hypothetical protein
MYTIAISKKPDNPLLLIETPHGSPPLPPRFPPLPLPSSGLPRGSRMPALRPGLIVARTSDNGRPHWLAASIRLDVTSRGGLMTPPLAFNLSAWLMPMRRLLAPSMAESG